MDDDVGSLVVRVAMENSSFQQGIQNLQRSMKVIESEFKTATAGMGEHEKGLDNLKAKSEMLSKTLDTQSKIVKAYEEKLKESKNTLENSARKQIELADAVNKAEKSYKDSEKTLGKNAEETKKLKDEYEKLQAEFTKGEEKIRNNQRAIDNWTIKTNNAKTKLSEFETEFSKTNKEIDKQTSTWNKVGTSITEFGNKANSAGEKVGSIGKTLTTHISVPLFGLGLAAEKVGADFEAAMSRVKAISGATGEEFKKLNDLALKLGADTAFSSKESALGMENLASAGFNTNEIIAAMPGMLDLAASSGADLALSADIAASTLRGFGLEASQAGHVADVLAKAAADTNAQVEDTGEAMKYVAPVARAMGLSLEEVTAAIGKMSDAGIKGSQAGTTLRSALSRLADPSKEAAGAMKDIGFNAFDSHGKLLPLKDIIERLQNSTKNLTDKQKEQAISTIFGQEAMSGMLALVQTGPAELDKLTQSLKHSDGAAKEMAETMQDNVKGSVEQMKGSLETAGIKISEVLAPHIKVVADKITELANKFSGLSPTTQKFILAIAGIAIVIGPLLVGISSLIIAVGNISTTLGPLVAKFATAKTAVSGLGKTVLDSSFSFATIGTKLEGLGLQLSKFILGPWKLLGDGFKSLPKLIKSFSFADVLTKITAPLKNLPTLLSGAFKSIPGLFANLSKSFLNIGSTIIGLGPKIFNAIRSAFSIQGIMTAAKGALAIFTGPWGILALTIAAAIGGIIANWDSIKAWVEEHFGGTLPKNINDFKEIFSNAFNSIQQVFGEVWENIKQVASEAWAYIGPTIMDGVKAVQSFWNEVWPQIKQVFVEIWNVMKVVLAPAVAVLYTIISAQLGFIKAAWHDGWNVIKDTLKIVWDALTGIIRIAWDLISGIIKVGLDLLTGNWSKAWTDMKSIFSNLWNDIKKLFSDMAKDAVTWGKDMIQGIIDGIKGAIGGVKDAVTNVANTIRSYLHFTVPDVGPLSDADTYGADFMQLLADTINANSDKPEEAAKKTAELISNKISSIKDSAKKEVDKLNKELSQLNIDEEKALRGVKGSQRYAIQDEYEAKKRAVKDLIDLRKEQADNEIKELQRISKMSKEQMKEELEEKKKTIKQINDLAKSLVDALKEKYNEEYKVQEEAIKKDLDKLEKWKTDSEKLINEFYEDKIKAIEDAEKQKEYLERDNKELARLEEIKARIKELGTLTIESLETEEDKLEKIYDKRIKAIEDTSNVQIAAIQRELDAIDAAEKQQDRKEQDNEDVDKISKVKSAIEFEHDDFNKEQLQKELNNLNKERNKRLKKEAIEDKKESLKAQIDSIKENSDKEIAEIEKQKQAAIDQLKFQQGIKEEKLKLEEEYNNILKEREKRAHDEAIEEEKKILEKEKENKLEQINAIYEHEKSNYTERLNILKKFYDEKTKDATLQAEAERMIMNNNQEEIIDLLNSYSKDYKASGQTLGEQLVAGFEPQIQKIKDMISSINTSIQSARESALQAQSLAKNVTSITNNDTKTNNFNINVKGSNNSNNLESTIRSLVFTV